MNARDIDELIRHVDRTLRLRNIPQYTSLKTTLVRVRNDLARSERNLRVKCEHPRNAHNKKRACKKHQEEQRRLGEIMRRIYYVNSAAKHP